MFTRFCVFTRLFWTSATQKCNYGGGVIGYPSDRLYEEVAFIAFYFHWSREDVLNLSHAERLRWVNEIMRLR
ncbi:DUF6760 family protein [Pseudanabaena mucicola]|uniref:DUF6760 family protein n=1 Tax=Pseudanabaena mucicola TaxID=71190 RepID=UPI0038D3EA7A